MKKVITALFVAAFVSVHGFALEFILSPTIGYSNLSFEERSVSSSLNAMSIGLSAGLIIKNGFTLMFNNDIAPVGSGSAIQDGGSFDAKLDKGVAFEQSLILGRTFKLVDNKLYVNIGSGFAWGIAKINMSKDGGYSINVFDVNVGVPLQLGAQYFFTKNIGLNLTIFDVLAVGLGYYGDKLYPLAVNLAGFETVFTVKVGPMFKF